MLTVRSETLGLREGDLCLDLGCGGGRHTFEAARLGARSVAVDIDDAALKDVRAWLEALADESAVSPEAVGGCVAGNALALPFPDETFDRIIVSEVLEHVPLDLTAMHEIRRVLKPRGTAAITVPRWWPEVVCWALSREYHSNAGGHVRIYRRTQLLARLREAGLVPYASHHAHAFHAPYWWLKCLVGVRRDEARLPALYHRFLVWEMQQRRPWLRSVERWLDPILGKSVAVYLRKDAT
jgi:SAM-dependent methyltransferase